MQITELLAQMGGLQSMARELGVDEQQVASGADALLPAILGGFKKQAQAQPAGLEGLGGLLGQLGGGSLLDEVLAPQPTDASHGNEVLGQIFGSKDVSRTVANNAAAQSGLDPSLLKQMLPLLAMLVTGLMARQGGAAPAADAPGGMAGMGACVAAWAAVSAMRSPARWVAVALAEAVWADCSAACLAVRAPRAGLRSAAPAAWRRCWTWTATAIRWTTSCAWPARRCAEGPGAQALGSSRVNVGQPGRPGSGNGTIMACPGRCNPGRSSGQAGGCA